MSAKSVTKKLAKKRAKKKHKPGAAVGRAIDKKFAQARKIKKQIETLEKRHTKLIDQAYKLSEKHKRSRPSAPFIGPLLPE